MKTCETCRFWTGDKFIPVASCRRYPPGIGGSPDGFARAQPSHFPQSRIGDWCGEHTRKREAMMQATDDELAAVREWFDDMGTCFDDAIPYDEKGWKVRELFRDMAKRGLLFKLRIDGDGRQFYARTQQVADQIRQGVGDTPHQGGGDAKV